MKKIIILSLMFLIILSATCFADTNIIDIDLNKDFEEASYIVEEPDHKLLHIVCPTNCELTIRKENQILGQLKLNDSTLTIDSENNTPLRITGYDNWKNYKENEMKIQVVNGQFIGLSKGVEINFLPKYSIHKDMATAYAEKEMERFNKELPKKELDRNYFNSFRVELIENSEGTEATLLICDEMFINLFGKLPGESELTKKTRFDVKIKNNEGCEIYGVMSTDDSEALILPTTSEIPLLFQGQNLVYKRDPKSITRLFNCEFKDCNSLIAFGIDNNFVIIDKKKTTEDLAYLNLAQLKSLKIEKEETKMGNVVRTNKITFERYENNKNTLFLQNGILLMIPEKENKIEMYTYKKNEERFFSIFLPHGLYERSDQEWKTKFEKTELKEYYELIFSKEGNITYVGDNLGPNRPLIEGEAVNVNLLKDFKDKLMIFSPNKGGIIKQKNAPFRYHKVKQGDTLTSLSKEYGIKLLYLMYGNTPNENLKINNQKGAEKNNEQPIKIPDDYNLNKEEYFEQQLKPIGMYIGIPLEVHEYTTQENDKKVTVYPQGKEIINQKGRNIKIRTPRGCSELGGECLYYDPIVHDGLKCGEDKIIYEGLCPYNNHVRCCASEDQQNLQQHRTTTSKSNLRQTQRTNNYQELGSICTITLEELDGSRQKIAFQTNVEYCLNNDIYEMTCSDGETSSPSKIKECNTDEICILKFSKASCQKKCVELISDKKIKTWDEKGKVSTISPYCQDIPAFGNGILTIPRCKPDGTVEYITEDCPQGCANDGKSCKIRYRITKEERVDFPNIKSSIGRSTNPLEELESSR